MDRLKTIKTFSILGNSMKKWGAKADREAFNPFVAGEFYDRMQTAILGAEAHNGWFSEASIRESLTQIGESLSEENLSAWVERYPLVKKPKSVRSEEHTSELQSRPHLVCRLLLEKKKI